jgi:hypothetical protein
MIPEPAAADVGPDYTCAGDGGAEQRCLLAHLIASPVRGPRLRPSWSWPSARRSAAATSSVIVERVLVVDVDDTGAP